MIVGEPKSVTSTVYCFEEQDVSILCGISLVLARITVTGTGTDVGNKPHRFIGGGVRVEFPSCSTFVTGEVDGIVNGVRHVLAHPSHGIVHLPSGVGCRVVSPQFLIASGVEIHDTVDVEGEV